MAICWLHRWKYGEVYEAMMFRMRYSNDLGLPLDAPEKVKYVVERQKAVCERCGKAKVRTVSR